MTTKGFLKHSKRAGENVSCILSCTRIHACGYKLIPKGLGSDNVEHRVILGDMSNRLPWDIKPPQKKKDITESGTENELGERLILHLIHQKAPYYRKGNYTSEKVAGDPQQFCGKRVSAGKRQAEPRNIYLEVYFSTMAELGNLKTLINKPTPGRSCTFCQQSLEVWSLPVWEGYNIRRTSRERAEVIENIKLRKRSSVWLLAAHTLSPLSAGQQHS